MCRIAVLLVVTALFSGTGCKGAKTKRQNLAPGRTTVTLAFGGDLSVARDVAAAVDKHGGGDPAYPFSLVQALVKDADLFFANIECALTDSESEEATAKTFRIRAPVDRAAKLGEVGIDVVSVANNHAMDFGEQGFLSTLATLEKQGIAATGVRENGKDGQDVLVMEVGTSRVGFLAYNQHGDEYKHPTFEKQSFSYVIENIVADVKRARPLVDFLVVSVHGGPELSHLPANWQQKHSRLVIDAGADLWLGHHPHVVQPVEEYKGKLIVYSLGDFVFDKRSEFLRDRTGPRFFLKVVLEDKKQKSWELVAGNHHRDYRPYLTPEFALEPWTKPQPAGYSLSEAIQHAKVERVRGDKVDLCVVEKARPKTSGGYLRWLAPRQMCADDAKTPWQTVAVTGELSNGVFARGVWAHPHEGGPLRITFPMVPLGVSLEGLAGVPDFGFYLGRKKPPGAVTVRVKIADATNPVVFEASFPFEKGWRAIDVDTTNLAGQKKDVVVEIEGGAGDKENRFMFDLRVPKPTGALPVEPEVVDEVDPGADPATTKPERSVD